VAGAVGSSVFKKPASAIYKIFVKKMPGVSAVGGLLAKLKKIKK
jgi:hypothetical protein